MEAESILTCYRVRVHCTCNGGRHLVLISAWVFEPRLPLVFGLIFVGRSLIEINCVQKNVILTYDATVYLI